MYVTPRTRTVRSSLTAVALAAVAAACMGSTVSGVSASGTHRSEVTSATKEWKRHSPLDTITATKEWKVSTSSSLTAPTTKEW
jgi:hypothetical protein